MINPKLRIGILGCANIAIKSIIPAILDLDDFFLLGGIASREKEKGYLNSLKFKTTPYYSYQDLITSNTIDIVYIPLPNSLHYEWVEKSLLNNKHVLVEKSMACSFDEVLKLNELAREKGLLLIENFQFRFHTQINKIIDIINSNEIGELRSITANFGFPPFADSNNIRYNKSLGGGALLDAGAYPIKLSQILLKGKNLKVTSAKLNYKNNINVDIWGGGFIEQLDGDLFFHFAFGFDNYYENSLRCWGSKGTLFTNRLFTAPKDYKTQIFIENSNGLQKIEIDEENHFTKMLIYFKEAIESKELKIQEYNQNIQQATLMNQFKKIINER
jgi:predicted dehydrogenase